MSLNKAVKTGAAAEDAERGAGEVQMRFSEDPAAGFRHLAYCGFDCGKCPLYFDGGAEEGAEGRCGGCKSAGGSVHKFCAECRYRRCAGGRGLSCCGECADYPCERIYGNTALSRDSIAVLSAVHERIFPKKQ